VKFPAAFAFGLILGGLWHAAHATPPAAAVTEINYLLDFIDRSGCMFYRNGSWYDSHRAQSHLRDKYNYLAARGRIKTADDFIEQAATRSSLSGEEYQIRCEAGPAVPSDRWLRTALIDYRSSVAPHASPNAQVNQPKSLAPRQLGRQAADRRMLYY
jgi:hypothetical protein